MTTLATHARRLARRTLIVMTPFAHKLIARYWFTVGFGLSGRGFHGEIFDAKKYPALVSLLFAEFERVWDERVAGKRPTRQPPYND